MLISEVTVDTLALGMEFLRTHTHQRNLEAAARFGKCHQSLNPQSGETFDQQAVAERLLLEKIRARSTYSSLGGVKVRR